VDLVAIDVAFTPQRLIVPAAATWLKAGGHVVSLLKPHYERAKLPDAPPRSGAPLDERQAEAVRDRVCDALAAMGLAPDAAVRSPLRGKGGGVEFLLHIRPGR